MISKEWLRIESLFHDALERREPERAAFLDRACGGDTKTRQHVESLIARAANSSESFQRDLLQAASEAFSNGPGHTMVGCTIDHYEIRSLLGAGGMGEVYLARDTKLVRDVAIKILAGFAQDRDRLSRFKNEALIIASLNHTNIAAIHELGECEGTPYLVLELVDGETLAERLKRGTPGLDEALKIAKQVAEGLEAAHARGIIHRDLKPANIKITKSGKAKVLDFGLAKVHSNGPHAGAELPTAGTAEGVILGTPAYMSPEQARGQQVDRRSDIWAFGCVFFEMLASRPAFGEATLTDTIAAVVGRNPDWNALPAHTPAAIRTLIRRCLEKDRDRRMHDISDVRIEIQDALSATSAGALTSTPDQSSRAKTKWLTGILAVTLVLSTIIATALYFGRALPEFPETWLEIHTPSDSTSSVISPDGRRLLFLATTEGKRRIWARPLDSDTAQPLAGTEGATFPFWSPDSHSIGFFADAKLKRIDFAVGSVQALADAPLARGGTWNRDDVIVYAPTASGALYRVPAKGGAPVQVTRLDAPRQLNHRFPEFLPDGRHFLYFAQGNTEGRGVYVASLDGHEQKRLLPDAAFNFNTGVVFATKHLLFLRQGMLVAQRFDPTKLELSGDAFPLSDNVRYFSASSTGVITFRSGPRLKGRMTWFDRSGHEMDSVGPPDLMAANPELSPTAPLLAVSSANGVSSDVLLLGLADGSQRRLTFDPELNWRPIWSPDGKWIVFASNRSGINNLYKTLASGAGPEELFVESSQHKIPNDWSPKGDVVLYFEDDPKSGSDLWATRVVDHSSFPVVNTPATEQQGQFSPDGRWIAYMSNGNAGRFEIYVQRFPGPGGKFQISTAGGGQPRWRRDGKELFYIALDGSLMAVPISIAPGGEALHASPPTRLFPTQIFGGAVQDTSQQQYAVSRDGQKFLINVAKEQSAAPPITVVLNWKPGSKK